MQLLKGLSKKLLKRLLVTIALTAIAIAYALIENALTYEVTSNDSFPWRRILKTPLFLGLIALAILYNIPEAIKVINDKFEVKKVDKEVVKEVKRKNYSKLYNHYINTLIEQNNIEEIKKELRDIEKRMA